MAKYEVEVWSKDNKPIGDIFHLCENMRWSKTRNDADMLSFDVDLTRYEEYIKAMGFGDNPKSFMEVGRNDIRVKRNGRYIIGTNIIKFGYKGSSSAVKMSVNASGYLNYYKKRYVTMNYSGKPQQDIMWGVIDMCNKMAGGDYGVRRGRHTGATVLRDRNQERKEVKSFLQQLSQVSKGCDFEITPDKLFNTYEAQGYYRPDMRLEYPGDIASFSFDRSVENVANVVYGIGSGNGEDAVQTKVEDATSQQAIYRREMIASYNSVTELSTLTQNATAVLHYSKDPIELPSITVENGALDLSDVGVGDTIYIKLNGNKSLQHIDGYYRIESISVSVDSNGWESVELTFDDIDINDIISKQEAV